MQFERQNIIRLYSPQRINQIYLLTEQRVAYVSNPKVACSSLKLMMERINRRDPEFVVKNIHKNREFPTLKKIGWQKVRTLISEGVYGFTFVRDPARRAVSGYRDKMRMAKFRSEINQVLGRELDEDVSFDQFLDALEQQDPQNMNPHWRPQHLVLMMDAIEYDYIGRLECISDDLDHIREASGLPIVNLEHRHAANRNSPEVELTSERRARIERIYAEDYERFSY